MASRILVADPIAEEGLSLLRQHGEVVVRPHKSPEELRALIGEYDALVVRSETRVTADLIAAGQRLQVIGRAGVGVDNIDVEAATDRGIVVVNAPEGNTISAAEHTIALMLALARHVPQANAALQAGRWQREPYLGVELRGKVLGIVGLGRVGSEVARRARSFEMRLLAHDPYISTDHFRILGVEPVSLDKLLEEADFVTVCTSLTSTARGLMGPSELARMKPTARLINASRGGVIDEAALYDALRDGRIAGAALDVFQAEPLSPESPLLGLPNLITTPHLGGSTVEAQTSVAVDVAEQIVAVLDGRPARYAVNAPFVSPEDYALVAPFLTVAGYIGRLAQQLVNGQPERLEVHYEGDIAARDTKPLRAAVLGGLYAGSTEERVTWVNVDLVAAKRGLRVTEQRTSEHETYGSLITATLTTSAGVASVGGTWMRGEPHIVRLDDWWLDVVPTPGTYWMLVRHHDRPGMIGTVGTLLGNADINISFMEVSREHPRGNAFMVLGLDDPVPEDQRALIRNIPDVASVRVVAL